MPVRPALVLKIPHNDFALKIADRVVILAASADDLRAASVYLDAMAHEVGLPINPSKTLLVAFHRKNGPVIRLPEFIINGKALSWEVMYLTLRITADLSPNLTVDDQIRTGQKT